MEATESGDPSEKLAEFQEYFQRDLEKGFTADVACCDRCFSDFVQLWPRLQRGPGINFERTAIDLTSFYSNSYLRDVYTEAQFYHHVSQLCCPRCLRPFGGSIWPYELPFNVPPNFEDVLEEVSRLARRTPFLLLQNPFCSSLLAAIADAARASETTEILAPLFRARTTADGLVDRELGAFDFPPARCAKEGRYNHAGCPVLYLGSDVETCHAELRGAPCLAIEFRLLVAIKILDLTDPFVSHEKQADLLNTVVWSAMLSAKQEDIGAYNPHYIFSRFVADCARAAGFHAIRYPSTRVEGFNLVIVDGIHTLKGAAEVLAYHERP